MGWWSDARTGAAHEFGRRHYRGFAAWEIGRRLVPLLLGAAVLVAILGGVRWLIGHWSDTGLPVHAPAGVDLPALPPLLVGGLAVLAVAAAVLARAVGWYLELYLPIERGGLWLWIVIMALGIAGAGLLWHQAG